jgi:sortase A
VSDGQDAERDGRPRRGSVFARVLGIVGRTMITAGVLILLFVAYQLWGTGIRAAQAQDELEDDLAELLEDASTTSTTSTTSSTLAPGTPTTVDRQPADTVPVAPELIPAEGEAAGQIVIPDAGVDWVFVEGVSVADLKKGPGHYPETPMPGQAGNAAIAGHRTTYGQPFHNLDQLEPGDLIEITTVQGEFSYEVRQTIIVRPSQVEVLGPDFWDFDGDPATPHHSLTLTACHPKNSARERIVVGAELVGDPVPVITRAGDDARPAPSSPTDFEGDLSGERAGAWPAVVWGLVCAAIWLAAWLVGRRRRRLRWPAYLAGFFPFLIALFLFFENFSRLLPANF